MTNPYQINSTKALTATQAGGAHLSKQCIAIALLMTVPLWLVMGGVQSQLLDAGIINTKDMAPLVGNETGTIAEYLLNVWHWDAVILLLFLASIPNTVIGIWLLHKRR